MLMSEYIYYIIDWCMTARSIFQVKNYHHDFYRPENLCLIITGQVDPDSVFSALNPFEQRIMSKVHKSNNVSLFIYILYVRKIVFKNEIINLPINTNCNNCNCTLLLNATIIIPPITMLGELLESS